MTLAPRVGFLIGILVSTFALAQTAVKPPTSGKPPAPKPWLEMDYGPVISATLESGYPARNVTQKGVLIRLDEASQAHVLFDADLLRYSVAYEGGSIDWRGVLFDGAHRTWASVAGRPIFGLSLAPGWGTGGDFADPRVRYPSTDYVKGSKEWENRAYGPLPRGHGQYKGMYFHGQRAVLSYTVGGVAVLDSPTLERAGGTAVIARTINVGKSEVDLDLAILEHPTDEAEILVGPRGVEPRLTGTAQGSVAVVGRLGVAAQATTKPADGAIAVVAKGAANGMKFGVTGESHLRLNIPAAATPAKIKLLHARVTAESLKAFIAHAEASPEPEDLAGLTTGGRPRYPQVLATRGSVGKGEGAFIVDGLAAPAENPFKARLRFGGFDFYPDGKSAAVCTWDGDVWRVSGFGEGLEKLEWRRIATGLHQPLGLRVLPDPRSADGGVAVVVACRDQIARLHDLNGDGEIDFHECVNNDHQVTEHFHEFAMGLQTDAAGNFYYAKSARHALDAVVPHHGTLLRVSADGGRTDVLATGFRAANGVGLGPKGELATSDQEGFWTPANRINLYVPGASESGPPFYGNMWSYRSRKRFVEEGFDGPLCWIPKDVDRSPAEQLWVTSERWGPLRGRMLHTSYGTGRLFVVPYEVVDGVPQGGVVPIPGIAFPTGVMRARFNPADGHLYLCGLVGWATNCAEPGGFYRVRYTGGAVHLPVELRARKQALSLTFTDPLDKAAAEDTGSYALQHWNYRWTKEYGSKAYSVADQKKVGRDPLEVTAATLSADGKTVTLTVPELRPVMQLKLDVNVKAAGGQAVKRTVHHTINRLPAQGD
jgi:hypothetical protein